MTQAPTTFDMIAIGDTTQDIFLQMSDATVQCDINHKACKICFDYADKIAVEKKTDIPAVGNAANHAIGMSRLKHRTALYTIVGDDTQGHIAADLLRQEGVDPRYVIYDKKRGTNFSAVINFQAERTIFVFHEPRDYQLPPLESTQYIYLTSASGGGVEALHHQVLEYLTANPAVKMAFNPGTHQLHLGLDKLRPLLQHTEWLFLNREEAAQILGEDATDVTELIRGFLKCGVKQMIMTDGPAGAYATNGQEILFLPIFAGPVVERTGAGDAFGSGFIGGLLHGKSVAEAMMWANANSTSVVQYIGAREGLVTPAQADQISAANPTITPTSFAQL